MIKRKSQPFKNEFYILFISLNINVLFLFLIMKNTFINHPDPSDKTTEIKLVSTAGKNVTER